MRELIMSLSRSPYARSKPNNKKAAFAPKSTLLALEPRILFDGAAAVAGADALADGGWQPEQHDADAGHQAEDTGVQNSLGGDNSAFFLFNATMADGDDGPPVVPTITDPLPVDTVRGTAEDTVFNPFGGANSLYFSGANGGDTIATLTITATGGTFNGGTDATLTFTGQTLADIKAALQNLTFTPDADQNSSVGGYEPTITLSFEGRPDVVISLAVTAMNDAPVLSGHALVVGEGESQSFSLDQLVGSGLAADLDVDIRTGQQVSDQLVMVITSLPADGTLSYKGGMVAVGMVIPVGDIGSLTYTHNGTDLGAPKTVQFGIQVHDGGGGCVSGFIDITIEPRNTDPIISGNPSLIEGQVKVVAPAINLGDGYDTLENSTIVISDIVTGGQGVLFLDANDNGIVDEGEALSGTVTLTAAQAAQLSTQLKFAHNGAEPNAPGAVQPSYKITITDAGGGQGAAVAEPVSSTILIKVIPNNDDPVLENQHADAGSALQVDEGQTSYLLKDLITVSDVDRNAANPDQTTPANQLVYTIETRPTQGELQLFVGGTVGPNNDGWIILGDGGRFTQQQINDGHVRYFQTTNVSVDTADLFSFTVRDSAFGYDVWTDPANPVSDREGGVRDTATGAIATQEFHFLVRADVTPRDPEQYEGDPRPATPGYGGSNTNYDFSKIEGSTDGNGGTAWPEATDGAYVITNGMLGYVITRTDDSGTPGDPADDIHIVVPPEETVYTLTGQPSNGVVQQRLGDDGQWQTIPTNGQFTQADINAGRIRFVHDGSEDHTASFSYTVSDGTPVNNPGTFSIDITPTNDRPAAEGGHAQVQEGGGETVSLGRDVIGMVDVDGSLDSDKQTGEGAQDFLWFRVTELPLHGTLQRWDGSEWQNVAVGDWLPSSLLDAAVGGATSGLRYVHDGSEPLTYGGGPLVTFKYDVRDDLADPANPWATDNSVPTLADGSIQSNLSGIGIATIFVIPKNDAPQVPNLPTGNNVDPDTSTVDTIVGGGATTSKNEILVIDEGGSGNLQGKLIAVDRDNTTTQRQYRITQVPTEGTLLLNGKALGVGSTFTQKDIDEGRITYKHKGGDAASSTLAGLQYHDKFHFVVSDGVEVDSGTGGDHNIFMIRVSPTNDAPVIMGPGSMDVTGAGDAYVAVPPITIADNDIYDGSSTEDFLRVEVRWVDVNGNPVAGAKITYTAVDPSVVDPDSRGYVFGKDSEFLIIQGTKAEVQAILNSLRVAMAAGTDRDSTTDRLEITVDDRLYYGGGSSNPGVIDTDAGANGGTVNQGHTDATPKPINDNNNRATHTITLLASNFNDPPAISNSNGSYTVNEDATLTLGGYTLSDDDSFDRNVSVTVQLFTDSGYSTLATAEQGALGLGAVANVVSAVNPDGTITLTGKIGDVQTALNNLTFKGATDFNNGPLYLRATIADFNHADGQKTASIDRTITIVPVNDAPVLTIGTPNFVLSSGSDIGITGIEFQDVRDTGQGASDDNYTVTIVASAGVLSATNQGGAAATSPDGGKTLTITGSRNDVNATLATLRFTPPVSNADLSYELDITVNDHDNGKEGTGVGGNNTATGKVTVFVSSVNNPADINANDITIKEGNSSSSDGGSTTLNLGTITVDDPDDNGGMMTATVSIPAGFKISTVGGAGGTVSGVGTNVITITGTEAQLNSRLSAITVTFPDPAGTEARTQDWNGQFDVTIVVSDQGNTGVRPDDLVGPDDRADSDNPRDQGGDYDYVDPDSNQLKTTRIITVTVEGVNDAPVRIGGANVTMTVAEDAGNGAGNGGSSVSALFGGKFNDQRDQIGGSGTSANGFAGVAIVGNAAVDAQGAWQYSTDNGATWVTIASSGVSTSSAIFLAPDALLRFVPADNFHGTPGQLTVRLADDSGGGQPTSGTTGVNVGSGGGISRYSNSANAVNLVLTVTSVNDAPAISGEATLTGAEDGPASNTITAGQVLGQLAYSDATDNQQGIAGGGTTETTVGQAIAITGNAADATDGKWQYTLNGTDWLDVPAGSSSSDGNAIVLDTSNAQHQLRFVPTSPSTYNGTPGGLTVRVADGTWNSATGLQDISAIVGGTGAWSATTGAISVAIAPRNDAPAFTHTPANPTVVEDATTGGSTSIPPTKLLGSGTVSDIDLTSTGGLDVDVFGAGSITVKLTSGGFASSGDVFQVANDLLLGGFPAAGIASITGGVNGADLVIQLSDDATLDQVAAILAAIEYRNTSDNPTNYGGNPTRGYSIELSDGNNAQGSDHAGGPQALKHTVNGTITITATNDPPTATDDANSMTEDAESVSGNVKTGTDGTVDTDPDNTNAQLSITYIRTGPETGGDAGADVQVEPGSASDRDGAAVVGTYGTLTIGADGSYVYTLHPNNEIVQNLIAGETLSEKFTYTLSDGDKTDQATLTITITGVNDGVTVTVPNNHTATTPDGDIADQVVFESGLAGGSNPDADDLKVDASFTLVALDGLDPTAAVVIAYTGADGNPATWPLSKAELEALGTTRQTLTTQYGTLELKGYSQAANGTITVDYEYTLTSAPDVTGTDTTDSFAITVKDRDGDTQSRSLNIKIVDDAPKAHADAHTVQEGATAPITGNVIGGAGATTGDAADVKGSDGASVTGVQVGAAAADTHVPGNVNSTEPKIINGLYGTLTLNADGSYSYQLDNTNLDVQALNLDGGTLQEVFGYTLTDGDGDQSTSTLTITITGDDDGVTVTVPNDRTATTPDADITDQVVFESGLAGGSAPNPADLKVDASFTLVALDGLDPTSAVVIAYTGADGNPATWPLSKAELEALGTTRQTLTTQYGTLELKGYSQAANGTITVDYEYTLTSAPDVTGTDTTDSFAITVKDRDGDTQSQSLNIKIVDDAPQAHADAHTVQEGATAPITGNVIGGAGASANDVADLKGSDGASVTGVQFGAVAAPGDHVADDNVATRIAGQYGWLTLNADGSYSYELDNTNLAVQGLHPSDPALQEVFSYTLTDGDGDQSTSTLTITITGEDDGVTVTVPDNRTATTPDADITDQVVFESGLTGGSNPDADDLKVDASFTLVALDGLDPTAAVVIAYTGADGDPATLTLTPSELEALSPTTPRTLTTQYGTLELKGYSKAANGTITVDYEYTLTSAPDVTGTDTTDTFAITVKDRDGDTQSRSLNIKIVDDAPKAHADAHTVQEGAAAPITGNVIGGAGATTGDVADIKGSDGAGVTGVQAGTVAAPGDHVADGNVATRIAGQYGWLTLNGDGSYSYELDNTNLAVQGLHPSDPALQEVFSYTLTDGDGDQSTATLTITINGINDLVTVTVPNDHPATPVHGNIGDQVVFESGLAGGSAPNAADLKVDASFTLVALDGLDPTAAVVIAYTGADGNPATWPLSKAELEALGTTRQTLTTQYGTLELKGYSQAANGTITVDYEYTLTSAPDVTGTDTTDSFAITVKDRDGDTQSQSLNIKIVDDAPQANADAHTVQEGATAPITGNVIGGAGASANDVADLKGSDGASVTGVQFGAVAAPGDHVADGHVATRIAGQYGWLTLNGDGSYSYELDNTNLAVQGLHPSDPALQEVFSYTLTDGDGDRSTSTLTITITGDDDGVTVTVPNDRTATTPDGDIADQVVFESGLAGGSNPNNNDLKVDASFTLVALDGLDPTAAVVIAYTGSDGNPATLTLSKAQLEALGTTGRTVTTQYGTLELKGYSQAANGTITVDYEYTLTSAPDVTGTDTTDAFAITVKDRDGDSSTQSLNIKIVDDAPKADADTNDISRGVEATVGGNVYTNDTIGADGPAAAGPVTPFTDQAGAYGSLTLGADGQYIYTLDTNNADVAALLGGQTLTDTFTYTVTDRDGDTTTAQLTITIHGNTPPVAEDDTRFVKEDEVLTGNLIDNGGSGDQTDSDADGDPLTVTEFKVDVDGDGNEETFLVSGGTPTTANIQGKGVITIHPDGSYTFTPEADWHGKVPDITYTIFDGKDRTATATLDITVEPVVDIADDHASTIAGRPVTTPVLRNDSFEGASPVVSVEPGGEPVNGTLTVNPDGTITYTPKPGFVGEDRYTYTVTSGGVTESATVTVTVDNLPPAPKPDTQIIPEDTTATGNVLTNDGTLKDGVYVDSDGHVVKVTGFEVQGKHYAPGETADIPGVGTITLRADGSYVFTPVADWNGIVPTINYTVSDGNSNGQASSTLDITVTPVPDAVEDRVKTEAATPVSLDPLDNDSFENPDRKITGITQGKGGTVTLGPDGKITYTPDPSFFGEDTFTYTVTSGGVTEITTVTVVVNGQNPVTPQEPFGGLPPYQGPLLQPLNPLMGDQVREPSVFFDGAVFSKVPRMNLPFHPVVYVNRQVQVAQQERSIDDARYFSDPRLFGDGEIQSASIGAGLGADPDLFVQHAVRQTQSQAGFLARIVEGRLGRVSLSSDRAIPTPELFQPNPQRLTPEMPARTPTAPDAAAVDAAETEAARIDAQDAPGEEATLRDSAALSAAEPALAVDDGAWRGPAAPSFTEQLRGGRGRLPTAVLAAHKPL